MCTDLVRAPGDEPNAAQAVWPASAQHLHLCDNFFIPRRCLQLHAHFILFFKMAQVCLVKPLRGRPTVMQMYSLRSISCRMISFSARRAGGSSPPAQAPRFPLSRRFCHRRGKAILASRAYSPSVPDSAQTAPQRLSSPVLSEWHKRCAGFIKGGNIRIFIDHPHRKPAFFRLLACGCGFSLKNPSLR